MTIARRTKNHPYSQYLQARVCGCDSLGNNGCGLWPIKPTQGARPWRATQLCGKGKGNAENGVPQPKKHKAIMGHASPPQLMRCQRSARERAHLTDLSGKRSAGGHGLIPNERFAYRLLPRFPRNLKKRDLILNVRFLRPWGCHVDVHLKALSIRSPKFQREPLPLEKGRAEVETLKGWPQVFSRVVPISTS